MLWGRTCPAPVVWEWPETACGHESGLTIAERRPVSVIPAQAGIQACSKNPGLRANPGFPPARE